MDRLLVVLLAVLVVSGPTVLAGPPAGQPLDAGQAPVDEALAERAREDPDAPVDVLVSVTGSADAHVDEAAALGLEVRYAYDHIPTIAGQAHAALVQELAAQPWVTEVAEDRVMHASMDVSRVEMLAPQANAAGYAGDGVNVAVLDTGIDRDHPALDGRVTGCVTYELGLQSPTCADDNGHGTHVAGTIGAQPTTLRSDVVGIAPQVTFSAVKVLGASGAGLTSDVIAGMEWVVDHADEHDIRVASMSLGAQTCGDGTSDAAEMANALVDHGIVTVVAAGNEGPERCTVTSPGTAEKVITVGAVDDQGTKNYADDALAGFSSRGPTADDRTKPDVLAPGVSITSTYLGGTYATLDGTSMATPHVSGVAAQMVDQDPTRTPEQVKAAMQDTALWLDAFPFDRPNSHAGHGFVNTCALLSLDDCSQPEDV